MRVGPKLQRNLAIDAEGLRLVRYKVAPGHTVGLHSHHGAQITIILEGAGVHRFVLEVEQHRRTRRVTTELPVGPGDCYYIPPYTPHGFQPEGRRSVVMIDIMVRPSPTGLSASELPPTGPKRARRAVGSRP